MTVRVEVCPVCKGSGKYLKISIANQVTGYDPDECTKTCWMCGGQGEVQKVAVKERINLHKYWFKDGSQYHRIAEAET